MRNWDCDDDRERGLTVGWLDMRYCWQCNDVSVKEQLFDVASVRITWEVVSLAKPSLLLLTLSGVGRIGRH